MQPLLTLTLATALAPSSVSELLKDTRRIVVVGAGGWVGRGLLRGLHSALGVDAFSERVFAFGSSPRMIDLGDAITIAQRPLDELVGLHPEPTTLFHLAFLTKDKVAVIDPDEYRETNRALSSTVLEALSAIGADRLFVASSGAAAFADDPSANEDLRIYGGLKREDEDRFVAWAEADTVRRAVITRIYNLTGPFINKHDTYALASFIIDALAGRPISVRAPMRVMRSYVAISELVSLVLFQLLGSSGASVYRYDSGGEVLELREVAAEVARVLGGTVVRAPITESVDNNYTGDAETYASLLEAAGIAAVPLGQQILNTAITIAPELHLR
ncbi:NAD-dependent epimerase/dehydratase family protein [Sphingorhabdus sp.]|jgi:nucleoside-diphosphate-sugar epimerase|uniref:NAD-dependent epimerase/dehydratase family protein n=1 Tax=Sphingorhabdus sp. TaxID=1902408 RepID=UPI0037845421